MKTIITIAALIQFYTSSLIDIKEFEQVKEIYLTIEADTNSSVNNLTSYIPSIFPINPIKQKRISDEFGNRYHPIKHKNIFHYGIDVAAKYGTPVHSTAAGIVTTIRASDDGYGKQIEMLHEFGFETKYAHLYTIMVEENQFINKGEVIGFVGSTGSSTGPHLHYEVIKNKKKINPLPFCYLNTIDTSKVNYYENENTEFVYGVENQIDSIVYPKGKKIINPKNTLLEPQKQLPIKPKRRDETESFGTMD